MLASHAVALAAVQGVCKGDMAGVKDETVANAQSVTPVGAFMVQEFLLNETSPISESEEMHKEIIGRITIGGRPAQARGGREYVLTCFFLRYLPFIYLFRLLACQCLAASVFYGQEYTGNLF